MAWLFEADRVVRAWPVAVGRATWQTPIGDFTVRSREQDKTWYVPVSIQQEMRREGKPVLTQVPPGPDNPLGRHWIGLSLPSIGIHGTNAPASVYGFRSHGCVRMHPDDVAELFARTRVGDAGQIIYEPLSMARDDAGRVWFEANPDAYRRGGGSRATVKALLAMLGLPEETIDWTRVDSMLENRDGQAREVGRVPNGGASR
jgi:L,D-transpeptidase ErfK/SrfK